MNKIILGVLSVCMGSGFLGACSGTDEGGNSNPNGVAKSADEAVGRKECFVGLPLPGVSYTGYACSGSSASSTVSAIGPTSWDDVRITVELSLKAPPTIGPLQLESLTIRVPNADETTSSWVAPVDGCTATAVKSAVDEGFGWTYYRIDIACTEPAMPAADNSKEPMELGSYSIVTFFAT